MNRKSRLSLHLLVLNGATTVKRMIEPLIGSINELVFADTGSTDGTPDILMEVGREHNLRVVGLNCSPEVDPDNFFIDDSGSFINRGFVLNDNLMGYTGSKLLKDWSKPRNLISANCSCDYILKMDGEDVMSGSSVKEIGNVKDFLDLERTIDFIACPYFVKKPTGEKTSDPYLYDVEMYTRFWRNKEHIRFREKCHENVDYLRRLDGSNWVMSNDAISVYDYRDGLLSGKSVKHRNFKCLLFEYDRCHRLSIPPSKHTLLYLAKEALQVDPFFSITVLQQIYGLSGCSPEHGFTKTDSAWYHFLLGLAKEKVGQEVDAIEDYACASSFVTFPRARLRIAMLHHKLEFTGWKDRLMETLNDCQKVLYPFGASCLERNKAISLVKD